MMDKQLKQAILDDGVEAVEKFLEHKLTGFEYAKDIQNEIEEKYSTMRDYEKKRLMQKYKIIN